MHFCNFSRGTCNIFGHFSPKALLICFFFLDFVGLESTLIKTQMMGQIQFWQKYIRYKSHLPVLFDVPKFLENCQNSSFLKQQTCRLYCYIVNVFTGTVKWKCLCDYNTTRTCRTCTTRTSRVHAVSLLSFHIETFYFPVYHCFRCITVCSNLLNQDSERQSSGLCRVILGCSIKNNLSYLCLLFF